MLSLFLACTFLLGTETSVLADSSPCKEGSLRTDIFSFGQNENNEPTDKCKAAQLDDLQEIFIEEGFINERHNPDDLLRAIRKLWDEDGGEQAHMTRDLGEALGIDEELIRALMERGDKSGADPLGFWRGSFCKGEKKERLCIRISAGTGASFLQGRTGFYFYISDKNEDGFRSTGEAVIDIATGSKSTLSATIFDKDSGKNLASLKFTLKGNNSIVLTRDSEIKDSPADDAWVERILGEYTCPTYSNKMKKFKLLSSDFWKTATAEKVKKAIDDGAYINAQDDDDGRTPLIIASILNPDIEIIRLLIENGADVNQRDKEGKPILVYVSAKSSDPEMIKVLIENGAKVNEIFEDGVTLLMIASRINPEPEITKFFLHSGIDVNAKDVNGKTALDYAKGNENLYNSDVYKEMEELMSK